MFACLLAPPPPPVTFFLAFKGQMDLGGVGITQVGSEEVRTSRWTPRQRSSETTGGTSGSSSMSLKLCDSFMESWYESGTIKGRFSFNSRRTMKTRGPPKIILRNSQLKGKSHLKVI